MKLTSDQHNLLYDSLTYDPAQDSGKRKPFAAERYAVLETIKRLGYTYSYGEEQQLEVGISYAEVQEATGHETSFHDVVWNSRLLTSNFHFISPDNSDKKAKCTRYTWSDWQWYCDFVRAGVTDVASRYSTHPDKKAAKGEAGNITIYKTRKDERRSKVLCECGGDIEIEESAYQAMIEDADQMLRSADTASDYAYVAHIYRAAKAIAEQTKEVAEGKRTVHVAYTIQNTGRAYSRRSAVQGLPRVYKQRLLDGYNYDIKSCHDSILRFLFDRHGIEVPEWPDKADVDLPKSLVKPLSHAIKQTGTRQIPQSFADCYRGYKEGHDVATMIWEYVDFTLHGQESKAYVKRKTEEVLEILQNAYAELEDSLAELEKALETAEHPFGLDQGDCSTIAFHLQGWEAAAIQPLCAADEGTLLVDHDGYVTTTEPAEVQALWAEVVPKELQKHLELVEKPLADEDDEQKRERLLASQKQQKSASAAAEPRTLTSAGLDRPVKPTRQKRGVVRAYAEYLAQADYVVERVVGTDYAIDVLFEIQQAAREVTRASEATATDWIELQLTIASILEEVEREEIAVSRIRSALSAESAYKDLAVTTASHRDWLTSTGRFIRRWEADRSALEYAREHAEPVFA